MGKPLNDSVPKPKALFLSPESPYPMIGGGPLRSASLLEYLSRRFSVHAVVFHQDTDPPCAMPEGRVEKLDVIELPHHSRATTARAARNLRRMVRDRPPLLDRFSGFEDCLARLISGWHYDVAVIEHFWCAPYVRQVRSRSRRVILDLHNVESVWHRSLADAERGVRAVALRRFAAASEGLERRWIPAFDRLLVTSDNDADAVRRIAPRANLTVYPNALPEITQPARAERDEIVFSGNLEYAPNIVAVRFFHESIWPSLRSRWPGLKWKIAGKNPEAIQHIVRGDPLVELTGCIDDAVRALAGAKVAVVPVLAGSGTRIKILEAWAAGIAVVSTTLGAKGLDCRNGEHLVLADDAAAFTGAVSRLLASEQTRRQIASAGRRLYEDRYTWPAAWRRLDYVFGNDTVRQSV